MQTLSQSSISSTGLTVLCSQYLAHKPARCDTSSHNRIKFDEVHVRKLSIAKLWTVQQTDRLPCSHYLYCRRHRGSFAVLSDQEMTTGVGQMWLNPVLSGDIRIRQFPLDWPRNVGAGRTCRCVADASESIMDCHWKVLAVCVSVCVSVCPWSRRIIRAAGLCTVVWSHKTTVPSQSIYSSVLASLVCD